MFQQARVLVSHAQFVAAGRLYDSAIASTLDDPAAYLERGMGRELQSDFDGAIADYRRYLALNGTSVDRTQVENAIQGIQAARRRGVPYQSAINTLLLESPLTVPTWASHVPVLQNVLPRPGQSVVVAPSGTGQTTTVMGATGQPSGKRRASPQLRLVLLGLAALYLLWVVLPLGAEAAIVVLFRSSLQNTFDHNITDTFTSLNDHNKPFLDPLTPTFNNLLRNQNNGGVFGAYDNALDTVLLMLITATVLYLIGGLIALALIRFILVRYVGGVFRPATSS